MVQTRIFAFSHYPTLPGRTKEELLALRGEEEDEGDEYGE